MAHYFRWLIPNQIIYYRIVGDVPASDVLPVDRQMLSMLNASNAQQVHLVIDTTMMTKPPTVPATLRLTYLKHPQLGTIITNQRRNVETYIFNTVGKIFKLPARFVPTFEYGLAYLRSVDDSLPALDILKERLSVVQDETRQEHQDNSSKSS